MEDFILRSWELPPNCEAPLVAPAGAITEVEWHRQKIEAKIRTVKVANGVWWVFFQLSHKPTSNYVVQYASAWPIRPQSWSNRKTAPELSRIVRMATREQQFSFAHFLFVKEPQAIAFFSRTDCGWLDEREMITRFSMRPASKSWDSPRLHHWLLKQWQKPDSEVRFAWQWSQWSEKQRLEWLYDEANGLNKLIQVMEWALRSDPALQNGQEWSWYLEERGTLNDSSNTDRFRCENLPWENLDMHQISPRLWALRQFFVAHFLPLPPLRIKKPPLCVRDFDALHRSHIMARREIQTAELQLEAALNLRDWLRKNHAPAELLALIAARF